MNTLSKYKNIKLVVINESELRYEFRDRASEAGVLAKKLMKKLNISELLVTSGRRGMTYFNKKKSAKSPRSACKKNTILPKNRKTTPII